VNVLFIILATAGLVIAFVAMFKDPKNIFTYVGAAILSLFVLYRNIKVLRANKHTTTMETLKTIEDEPTLQSALNAESAVLYKHSTRCPISANVYHEVVKFASKNPGVPVYLLKVIEQRELSIKVADTFAVEHQSPQAFVVKNGTQVWNASHYDITAAKLQEQLKD
jgi:bacillithiol system protein YtxJ